MNAAFLFDADGDLYEGNYYWAVRKLIFDTGIVQASNRHMKMAVGDVGWRGSGRTREERLQALDAVFFQHRWGILQRERLARTFRRSEVFAVVFENMTEALAEALDAGLAADIRYLGVKEVSYEFGPHLVAYRLSISTVYRLQGTTCRVFFAMSDDDGKDLSEFETMHELGFIDVDWEDSGARKTIFDDYDTLEHFEGVAAFRTAVMPFLPDGRDDAFELVMLLEDLNPRLFNALSAAVVTLNTAQHEEHVAQAALSGRRYMEALADALFPPRSEPVNGRKVTKAEPKNRLWAFIAENLPAGDERLQLLGQEVDRLAREFSGGVHEDEREKERVLHALADAAKLTAALLTLNPSAARKPYLGFEKRMISFFRESLALGGEEPTAS